MSAYWKQSLIGLACLLPSLGLCQAGITEQEWSRYKTVLEELDRSPREAFDRMSHEELFRATRGFFLAWMPLEVKFSLGDVDFSEREAILERRGLKGLENRVLEKMGPAQERIPVAAREVMEKNLEQAVVAIPGYDVYTKRAIVGGSTAGIFPLRSAIDEEMEKSGEPPKPATIAARMPAPPYPKGVRSISYRDGVITIVYDREVVDGGELRWTAEPRVGGFSWKCTSSDSIRNFAPKSCR